MGKRYIKISMIIMLISLLTLFFVPKYMLEHKSYAKENLQILDKKQFAVLVKSEEDGEFKTYDGDQLFPTGYYLNKDSYCNDMEGKKIDTPIIYNGKSVTVRSNQTVYCTLYFEKIYATKLTYDNKESKTTCNTVQCALDELYKYMIRRDGNNEA